MTDLVRDRKLDYLESVEQMERSHARLLQALKCTLADLEGIMQTVEPSGDRRHPGWKSIKEAQRAILRAYPQPRA